MFCDNDDFVDKDWIQTLVKYIKQFPYSLISCEYTKVNVQNKLNKHIRIPIYKTVTHVPIEDYYIFYKYNYSPYIWIRIYNAEIVRDIKFNEKIYSGEDVLFNIEYMKYCNEFLYVPYNGYYYVEVSESLSRKYNAKYYDVLKPLYFPRTKIISKKYLQEFYDEYFYRFYNCIDIVMDKRNKMTKKKKIKYINYILKDAAFKDALKNASEKACGKKLKKILSLKNCRILFLFKKFT